MTKATHRKTRIDLIKNQKRQQKKAYGLERQNLTGYTTAAGGFTTMHQVSTANSGGSNQTSHSPNFSGITNFLDPIAFWMDTQLIYPTSGNNNTLDLSEETGAFTSHWIWAAAGSKELEIISNAQHSGQILFIESVDTETPKIVDRTNTSGGDTGNIKTLDGEDFTFPSNKTIVLFMFSSIDNLWHQVSNPVAGISLSDNNTWTGNNTFSGSITSITSGTITLGDSSADAVSIMGQATFSSSPNIPGSSSGLGFTSPSDGYFLIKHNNISKRVPYWDVS